jgi:hypothetical protein
MKAEILAKSLFGMPLPILTITENVETYLPYRD